MPIWVYNCCMWSVCVNAAVWLLAIIIIENWILFLPVKVSFSLCVLLIWSGVYQSGCLDMPAMCLCKPLSFDKFQFWLVVIATIKVWTLAGNGP